MGYDASITPPPKKKQKNPRITINFCYMIAAVGNFVK